MVEGNVVNILARVLLDDFATSGDVNTTFPLDEVNGTFASGDGFGLAATALDIADITDVREDFLSDIKGRLILTERIDNAPGFLRDFSTGLFSIYQKRGGALSINSIRLPFFQAAQETLDDDDSRLVGWARSFRDAYNYVTVEGDELPNGDSSILTEIDRTADASGIGRRDFVVKSPWLRTDLSGSAVAATMGSRIAARFSRGPIGAQFTSAFERAKLEPGDYVEITHPLMPDTVANDSASSVPGEVVAATLTPQGVQIKAQISTVRGGLIPPNTVTNYTTETEANQNKYLFISDDDGLDPDGSPAAVWV